MVSSLIVEVFKHFTIRLKHVTIRLKTTVPVFQMAITCKKMDVVLDTQTFLFQKNICIDRPQKLCMKRPLIVNSYIAKGEMKFQ